MEVDVRFFAIIREIVGRSAERRELSAGTTVGDVLSQLIVEHPRLERMRPVTMLMVNKAYVSPDHELRNGDELALIPPVSGGQPRFRVQSEALDPRITESLVAHPGAGAIATFIGTVRDHGRGRAVTHLEYEAYAPAAELTMAQIGDEIRDRWGTDHVAIIHRTGSLAVGEAMPRSKRAGMPSSASRRSFRSGRKSTMRMAPPGSGASGTIRSRSGEFLESGRSSVQDSPSPDRLC
jgi:molybdopterin converting factor subunit 1